MGVVVFVGKVVLCSAEGRPSLFSGGLGTGIVSGDGHRETACELFGRRLGAETSGVGAETCGGNFRRQYGARRLAASGRRPSWGVMQRENACMIRFFSL